MTGHFDNHEIFLRRNNPGIILSDYFLQARVQAAYRNLIQSDFLKYNLIVQVIKRFDHVDDLFNLPGKLNDLRFRGGHLYGDAVYSLFPAFRSGESIYIDTPSGKNQGRSEEHTSELQSRENLVC